MESSRVLAQAGESRAGLVVQFADGTVQQFCIAFPGDSISGLDLLRRSGLEVQAEAYGGMGGLVCKIGPDGCDYPQQPCVCLSYGPGGKYWSYHHLKEGKWRTSAIGAASYKVQDGDVEGWAWSDGKSPALIPAFAGLCSTAGASPAPTQPVASPTPPRPPSLTATRQPSRTPRLRAALTATPARRPATATLTAAPRTEPNATWTATAAPLATHTPLPAPSATATSRPAAAEVPTLTSTPSPTAAVPATETATAAPPQAASQLAGTDEARVRVIAIAAGLVTALGFVLWRLLAGLRRGP